MDDSLSIFLSPTISLTLLFTCLQNPATHPTSQGSDTAHPKLKPFFFFSQSCSSPSAPSLGARHHQPPTFQATHHCYRQLSPLWCFTPNQIIKQILTRHPERFTNPPHSYQYAPGSAITSLGLDCCYKPPSGLADSCHDPKICPPPWAWTNGSWRKAVCENTGMWHQPPRWERQNSCLSPSQMTKKMSHLTRQDSRASSAWIWPWCLKPGFISRRSPRP